MIKNYIFLLCFSFSGLISQNDSEIMLEDLAFYEYGILFDKFNLFAKKISKVKIDAKTYALKSSEYYVFIESDRPFTIKSYLSAHYDQNDYDHRRLVSYKFAIKTYSSNYSSRSINGVDEFNLENTYHFLNVDSINLLNLFSLERLDTYKLADRRLHYSRRVDLLNKAIFKIIKEPNNSYKKDYFELTSNGKTSCSRGAIPFVKLNTGSKSDNLYVSDSSDIKTLKTNIWYNDNYKSLSIIYSDKLMMRDEMEFIKNFEKDLRQGWESQGGSFSSYRAKYLKLFGNIDLKHVDFYNGMPEQQFYKTEFKYSLNYFTKTKYKWTMFHKIMSPYHHGMTFIPEKSDFIKENYDIPAEYGLYEGGCYSTDTGEYKFVNGLLNISYNERGKIKSLDWTDCIFKSCGLYTNQFIYYGDESMYSIFFRTGYSKDTLVVERLRNGIDLPKMNNLEMYDSISIVDYSKFNDYNLRNLIIPNKTKYIQTSEKKFDVNDSEDYIQVVMSDLKNFKTEKLDISKIHTYYTVRKKSKNEFLIYSFYFKLNEQKSGIKVYFRYKDHVKYIPVTK